MPIKPFENFAGNFNTQDWAECFDMTSPNSYSLSRERSDVTLAGDISWSKTKAAVQYLLGYSCSDNEQLHRVNPSRHPYFPWLRCNQVSLCPKGYGSRQPAEFPDTFNYGNYARNIVTASYVPQPYNHVEDGSPYINDRLFAQNSPLYGSTGEFWRHVETSTDSYTELLTLESGQVVYVSPGVAVDTKPILTSKPMIRQSKTKFILKWHEVPDTYIQPDDSTFPQKFFDMQKCVNRYPFFGFPVGTLLCESIKTTKYVTPVASDFLDKQLFYYDVEMEFIYFNPPKDPAVLAAGGYGTIGINAWPMAGWNLYPSINGFYYPGRYTTMSGSSLVFVYPFYDFSAAFTQYSVPPNIL